MNINSNEDQKLKKKKIVFLILGIIFTVVGVTVAVLGFVFIGKPNIFNPIISFVMIFGGVILAIFLGITFIRLGAGKSVSIIINGKAYNKSLTSSQKEEIFKTLSDKKADISQALNKNEGKYTTLNGQKIYSNSDNGLSQRTPEQTQTLYTQLRDLKRAYEEDLITKEEYLKERQDFLDQNNK